MDFEWVAIAASDVVWILIAFVLGLLAKSVRLPPLVGFLAAGFLLNAQGVVGGEMLAKLSDLGITLLLFIVGLKLNIKSLARPQVWAVTCLHTSIVVALLGAIIFALAYTDIPIIGGLSLEQSLIIAFALSFSSTVFVVKVLEESGQMAALHGRIAIGILIVQDLAAVIYLAMSTGVWPSYWALLLLLLIPLKPVLHMILQRAGHGELLILYGFLLAMGGAEIFQLVELKGDLGALVLGVLMANHPKSDELSKSMLGFKDLFLLGFFLSIGLSGAITLEIFAIGVLIVPFIFIKSALFFALLTRFNLRARTALITSSNLTNFSEFGLIVSAISVANGWINSEWLIVIAVALSISYVIASLLNSLSNHVYATYRPSLVKFQKEHRIEDEQMIDIDSAEILVIGMGRIGTGAYDKLEEQYGSRVVGIDIDHLTVKKRRSEGRRVLIGDPSDYDFWDRVQAAHTLKLVMLALPKPSASLEIIEQLRDFSFDGTIAATVRFPDEVERLKEAGAATAFNFYNEAGAGFASHVISAGLAEGVRERQNEQFNREKS